MLWATKVAEDVVQILNFRVKFMGLEARKARKHDPDGIDLFLCHKMR